MLLNIYMLQYALSENIDQFQELEIKCTPIFLLLISLQINEQQ